MIFLIEYDRRAGKLMLFRRFEEKQKNKAQHPRFELELKLNQRSVDHEVVLLEAENEVAVRQTHRRYFQDFGTLLKTTGQAVKEMDVQGL